MTSEKKERGVGTDYEGVTEEGKYLNDKDKCISFTRW